ncbi:unnamed protein product [Meloidogyne enterolobii]|uniref:Uncharacterized protein n=1 Tax=Meloidogyne enterolobii TaxID=390850 RepID=A0ACB0ZEI2_MELEN
MRSSELAHADCSAHLLNLIVHNALKNTSVNDILIKCRKIVGHFKHSNSAVSAFKKIQLEEDLPQHFLLQVTILKFSLIFKIKDIPTRWNSAFFMCKRLIEQRAAIQNYAFKKERQDLDLTDNEWAILGELVELLSPLEELTRLFSGSSISVQYSFAKMTEKKVSEMNLLRVEPTRQLIVKGFHERFWNLIKIREIAVSQFLDPRLKDKNTDIPELFRHEVFIFLDQEMTPIDCETIEFNFEPPAKVMKQGLLDDFAESMDVQAEHQTSTAPNLRREFDEYCSMARESIKSDPLDFWKSNQKKFPLLSEAARKYLSPPATSVPSEQLFSTARDVFTYRRMSIGPRKAEMVIFLNRILPLIDFKF